MRAHRRVPKIAIWWRRQLHRRCQQQISNPSWKRAIGCSVISAIWIESVVTQQKLLPSMKKTELYSCREPVRGSKALCRNKTRNWKLLGQRNEDESHCVCQRPPIWNPWRNIFPERWRDSVFSVNDVFLSHASSPVSIICVISLTYNMTINNILHTDKLDGACDSTLLRAPKTTAWFVARWE